MQRGEEMKAARWRNRKTKRSALLLSFFFFLLSRFFKILFFLFIFFNLNLADAGLPPFSFLLFFFFPCLQFQNSNSTPNGQMV